MAEDEKIEEEIETVEPKQPTSRPARWQRACEKIREAMQKLEDIKNNTEQNEVAELMNALEELNELRTEYEDWRDNMAENLQSSPTFEKLEEVCNLDPEAIAITIEIEGWEELESLVDAAEAMDLPRGFGRD